MLNQYNDLVYATWNTRYLMSYMLIYARVSVVISHMYSVQNIIWKSLMLLGDEVKTKYFSVVWSKLSKKKVN